MNWRAISTLAAVLPLIDLWSLTQAQEPATVSVQVVSGRQWEGIIDSRSSDQQLVLRFERGGAVLWRPIAWQDIRMATHEGESLSAAELAGVYRSLATSAKSQAERAKFNPQPASPSDLPAEEQPPLPPTKVLSIACDALLANWDADVEADGLVIHLQPLDAWQQVAVVSGTLEVELFALQARAFHHAPQSRGRSLEPIARWAQAVNLAEYTTRGAVIRLPFQAAHPEFDDTLGAYGLVHLKFSVPGSGVFEQTMDGVRIRPWSPLRDYLQMDTGRRFLPHETTGRGKNSWFTDDQ